MKADNSNTVAVLLTLIKAAEEPVSGKVLPDNVCWPAVFSLSSAQGVSGIASQGLQRIFDEAFEENRSSLSVLSENNNTRKEMLKWGFKAINYEKLLERHDSLAARITSEFEANGFQCCILKGQGLAHLYVHPEKRQPGDMDIWVLPKDTVGDFRNDRVRVINFLKGHWTVDKPTYHHCQADIEQGISTEIHYLPAWLYNPFANRVLLNFFREEIPSQFKQNTGKGYAVPDNRFNLIFLMAHLSKHSLDSNIMFKQVLDYAQVLKASTVQDRVWAYDKLGKLGLKSFAGSIMWTLKTSFNVDPQYLLCNPKRKPCLSIPLCEAFWKTPWRIWHWFFRKRIINKTS